MGFVYVDVRQASGLLYYMALALNGEKGVSCSAKFTSVLHYYNAEVFMYFMLNRVILECRINVVFMTVVSWCKRMKDASYAPHLFYVKSNRVIASKG